MIKKIKVSGIRNIRALCAYKTYDGKSIKEFSLIRSGRLDKAKIKKRNKFINDYNIKTVIDLRTEVEVKEGKEVKYLSDIDHIFIPLLDKAYFGITHEKKMRKALYNESKKIKDKSYYKTFMVNMYKGIIFDEASQSHLRNFFDALINKKDGNVLFHCTGGKDRTGVVSFLLLYILGVSQEDILHDFSQSDIFNKWHNRILSFLMDLIMFPCVRFRKLLKAMLYAKKEYLEKTIETIIEKYGSINNYIKDILLIDDVKTNKLRTIFLEK